jgi:riboflavin transporter FmnP
MGQEDKIELQSPRSRTQILTGIALFASLAIILNFLIRVPAPYLPFLYYEVWEIPIVAVLLIFGMGSAVAVSLLNAAVLIVVFPGNLPTGPLYNLAAILVTLVAVSASHRVGSKMKFSTRRLILVATGSGILVRSLAMMAFNFVLLPFPPPIGYNDPTAAVIPILPLIAFFNATVVLYSVPFGYAVVKAVSYRFRFKLAHPLAPSQKTVT